MTNSKKLFVLAIICLLSLFGQNQLSANLPHIVTLDGFGYDYSTTNIPAPPADGTQVFATHKKSGNQLVLTARGGKIIEIAAKNAKTGRIKVLEGTTAACSGDLCQKFQVKTCFNTPWGDCFCICGDWFTSNSNASSPSTGTAPTTFAAPNFDDSYLVDEDEKPKLVGGNLEGYILDDQMILDTDPATGANLILIVKNDQVVGMTVQFADGTTKSLEDSGSTACSDSGPCRKFQVKKCYSTPWGNCICVCGAFVAPSSGK